MAKFRNFSPELELLADAWSTSTFAADRWNPTGKKWQTNSHPIEVVNQNNLRGVAKPGDPIADKCLRAAHEKIVSDLAYVLGLPVPPVILWDRGAAHAGERYCAISAWAFPQAIEWPHAHPRLSPEQIEIAKSIAGAMRVFDTWIAASDRKGDHVLVRDDGDRTSLGLAQIDYAFALGWEWCGVVGHQPDPRAAFPDGVGYDPSACEELIDAIEKLEEIRIKEIVNRVPAEYYAAVPNSRDVILSTLLSRRSGLRGWLK